MFESVDRYVDGVTGGHPLWLDPEGAGLEATRVSTADAFERAYREAVAYDGTSAVVCEVAPCDPSERPPYDYAHVKRRFRAALRE